MTKRRRGSRVGRGCLGAAAVFVAASCVVVKGLPLVQSTIFPGYREVTKAVAWALAVVTSFSPVALWDLGIACGVVALLVVVVRRVRRRRSVLPAIAVAAFVAALSAFLFVAWAGNHYAPPLADELGLAVRAYSVDELAEATEHYLSDAAELAGQAPRDGEGSLERQDFFGLSRVAGASYEGLAETYAVFRGPTVPVKALLAWGAPLLYSGHTGIYWAPTGEAGVPLDCAVADTPFIMCHEAAHRLAIASEQEANFAAYLACSASDDVRFAYSGAFNAFCYCYNALYRADPERAQALLQGAAQGDLRQGVALVLADWDATSAHYRAYDGPFKEVGTTVNDTYLKGFGEPSGVRSYGLVVDYLIAWQSGSEGQAL